MVEFIKMHGIGNDYIYIDCIAHPIPTDIEEFARHASDRHTGIGGDGVVLILPSEVADCRMRMFNADGSEGRMCGNAIRCVGKYYYETYTSKTQGAGSKEQGVGSKEQGAENAKCIIPNFSFPIPHSSLSIETLSGIKHLTLNVVNNIVESVTVDMGMPSLNPSDIPVISDAPFVNQEISIESNNHCALCIVHCALAVSMGNPHLILPTDNIDHYPLHELGPLWEHHPLFPDRVNTEIVEQLSPTHLRMRVWERGSGETLACGTGACAVVVAFTHLGRVPKGEPITVSLTGGDLIITYQDNNHVLMQGTATEVFRGTIKF